MKVSIVIPVFNRSDVLSFCLESIFNSSFKDFEVVVVDDNSSENIKKICNNFKCRYFRFDIKKGASSARNFGVSKSKGKYILFTNADCFFYKDTIKRLIYSIEHNKCDAVVGYYSVHPLYKNFYSKYKNYFILNSHNQKVNINWFWTACGLIKRDAFLKVRGFSLEYKGATVEDIDLGYRLTEKHNRIILEKKAKVQHMHKYTLISVLGNDLRKSKDWAYLLLKSKIKSKHKNTSITNYMNVIIPLLGAVIIISALNNHMIATLLMPVLITSFFVNFDFVNIIYKREGIFFLIMALFFLNINFLIVGLGALSGVIKFVKTLK